MDLSGILSIIGGLVLFLYGITAMGENLRKISGGKMEQILQSLTSNRWKGALLGALVTAVIQSSGATIVMVVGFVNSGIMQLSQSVGVILGANVGTTITSWILSLTGIESENLFLSMLKPANFSPIVGIIGVFMMMFCSGQKKKDVGSLLTSFAVLMLGMTAMSDGAAPLAENEEFVGLLTAFSNPFLGLLVGLLVTVILQSSSASIGILQSLSLTGVLTMGSAIPVIMGENIGSSITAIMGSIGASRNARRAALVQLTFCLLKTSVFMLLFYPLNAIFHFPIMDMIASPVSIAVFHSIFNIAAVLIMLPLSDFLVKIVTKILPVTEEEEADSRRREELQMLDPRFVQSAHFALEQCSSAAGRMSEYAQEAVSTALDLVLEYSDEGFAKVEQLERTVDAYEDQLNNYLSHIAGMNFPEKDSRKFTLLLHCIGDFERMTDHALNIAQSAQEMHEKKQAFSPRAQEEMQVFHAALRDILDRTVRAFRTGNVQLASTVEPLEEVIDGLNLEMKRRHVRRLRKGKCSAETGMILEDITTDYERIADHCNNVAVQLSMMQEENYDSHDYIDHLESEARRDFLSNVALFEARYRLPGAEVTAEFEPIEKTSAGSTSGKTTLLTAGDGGGEAPAVPAPQEQSRKKSEKPEKSDKKSDRKKGGKK